MTEFHKTDIDNRGLLKHGQRPLNSPINTAFVNYIYGQSAGCMQVCIHHAEPPREHRYER